MVPNTLCWRGAADSYWHPNATRLRRIHRDGADYIISALVIGKQNIMGGTSTVFSPEMDEKLLEHELAAGEGLFHEDRQLWHDVTKIYPGPDATAYGYRDIFGLDVILDDTNNARSSSNWQC